MRSQPVIYSIQKLTRLGNWTCHLIDLAWSSLHNRPMLWWGFASVAADLFGEAGSRNRLSSCSYVHDHRVVSRSRPKGNSPKCCAVNIIFASICETASWLTGSVPMVKVQVTQLQLIVEDWR